MFKNTISLSIAFTMLAIVVPVFAQTSSTTTSTPVSSTTLTKIACVGAAVNTREQAIDTAMTALTGSMNAAYGVRAAALQQAYVLDTLSTVRAAVKSAWSAFNTSMKLDRKTWQTARNAAWSQYRTTATACRAPAGTGDGVDSVFEASGN